VKTVFFDVDTQLDFLYPAGALYVPGAEKIVEQIAALNRFAGAQGIPLVSTMDATARTILNSERGRRTAWRACIGQHKPEATLLTRRVVVPNLPNDVAIESGQQILLEKQTFDCFTNVNLRRFWRTVGRPSATWSMVVVDRDLREVRGLGTAQDRQNAWNWDGRGAQPERWRSGRNDGFVSRGGRPS